MSNDAAIDWFARNVHVWPAGDHQDWCFVGHGYHDTYLVARGNVIGISPVGMTKIYKNQWLARRAELQNKPSWKDAPEWAEWLAQDSAADGTGAWWWYRTMPAKGERTWSSKGESSRPTQERGEVLGDWRDTLERRPEYTKVCADGELANSVAEVFQPFISIEDNQEQRMAHQAATQQAEKQQDNSWFEHGELPPVGTRCEAYITNPEQWVETEIVARKDGFAIGWCKGVMMGCHGDKASEFRPIRTEREKAIEEMTEIMKGATTGLVLFEDGAAKLYDAGYRKEPK